MAGGLRQLYGDAALTAMGFFWKAGWAFVLGYWVSAMIQAFVPKGRLTPYLGKDDAGSVGLATLFGAASSSCSFAALATARSLVLKGAHFVAAVAFMFASTNLVIELGILILIFLGWQFLAAEIVGGLVLILVSTVLVRLTYPASWIAAARDRVERQGGEEDADFDWRKRIRSAAGWRLVGHKFVSDWQMVWEEILIGFTDRLHRGRPCRGCRPALALGTDLPAGTDGHLAVVGDRGRESPRRAVRGGRHVHRLDGQHPAGHGPQRQRGALRRHHGVHLLGPDGAAARDDQRQVLRLAVRGRPGRSSARLDTRPDSR